MELNYVKVSYPNKEAWKKEHTRFLGGTSASVILGASKYQNILQLFNKITNPNTEEEETNDVLQFGVESEPLIRKTFALNFPDYEVHEPNGYESYIRKDKTYLGATVDGLLTKRDTGDRYVLEIKTADIRDKKAYDEWQDKIPQAYYCQIIHYLMVMNDMKGVKLVAQLRYFDFDNETSDKVKKLETKFYHIERSEVEEDIAKVEKAEIEFWEKHIKTNIPPNLVIKKEDKLWE